MSNGNDAAGENATGGWLQSPAPDDSPVMASDDALLRVEGLVKHFPIKAGVFKHTVGAVRAVDGVDLSRPQGRDARHRRRVGLRQDDARPHDHQADRADSRLDRLRRPRHHRSQAARDAPDPARDPDRLPGPLRVVEPAHDRERDRGRAAADPQHLRRRGQEARRGAAADGRSQPGARQPLPARVLGRPAPADRRRPRARAQPVADRARRARLGARRLDPGAGRQPAREPAERLRAHVHVHRARPLRRPARLRPDRGHVPRQDRRDRRRGTTSTARRCIRTRRRSSPPSRSSRRTSAASEAGSCSRATCRAPRTRPRAAASGRAAGRRRRSAPSRSRRSSRTTRLGPSCSRPATSPRWCGRSSCRRTRRPPQRRRRRSSAGYCRCSSGLCRSSALTLMPSRRRFASAACTVFHCSKFRARVACGLGREGLERLDGRDDLVGERDQAVGEQVALVLQPARSVCLADVAGGATDVDGGDLHPRHQVLQGGRVDDLGEAGVGVVAGRDDGCRELLLGRLAAAATGGEQHGDERENDQDRAKHAAIVATGFEPF